MFEIEEFSPAAEAVENALNRKPFLEHKSLLRGARIYVQVELRNKFQPGIDIISLSRVQI